MPPLSRRDAGVMERFSHEDIGRTNPRAYLLGTRGPRAFYRIAMGDASDCYAAGAADSSAARFTRVQCATAFPSPARPVIDFTVVHVVPEGAATKTLVWKSEGIAADGIGTVGLVDAGGRLIRETAVTHNLYRFDDVPEEPVAGITYLDLTGKTVYEMSF